MFDRAIDRPVGKQGLRRIPQIGDMCGISVESIGRELGRRAETCA